MATQFIDAGTNLQIITDGTVRVFPKGERLKAIARTTYFALNFDGKEILRITTANRANVTAPVSSSLADLSSKLLAMMAISVTSGGGSGVSAAAIAKQFKNNGYSIVSTNPCSLQDTATASSLAILDRTAKVRHVATAKASKLVFLYANYAQIQGVSFNSAYNSVMVGAALQKAGTGPTDDTGFLFTKSFPNGKSHANVSPQSFVLTNPAFFDVEKNERFFSRTYQSVILPASPTAPTVTASSTGGSLTASSVFNICYTIVFPDGFESAASAFAAATTPAGSTSSIAVTSPAAVAGALGYRLYMTAAGAANTTLYNFLPSNSLTPFGTDAVIQYIANPNQQRFVRSGGTVYAPQGGGIAGATNNAGLNSGEYALQGDHTLAGFRSVAGSTLVKCYYPSAILGKTETPQKTVGIIGDSIQAGTGDHGYTNANGGFAVRALTNQLLPIFDLTIDPLYGYVKVALGGEKASQFANTSNANQFSRVRLAITEYATNVISDYGTNDLGDGLAVMQASILQIAKWYTSRGIKFFQTTLFPRSASSDGWVTATNQTPEGGAQGVTRVDFNNWIRDQSNAGFMAQANAPGLVDFIDVCKYTEVNASNVLTLNGGRWRVTGSAAVLSGTFTAVNANYEFVDSTKTMTPNQYKGYNILVTSGVAAGKQSCLSYNTATVFNTNQTTIGATPAIGDSYEIRLLPTVDDIHPSSQGHIWGAMAVQEKFDALI